MGSEAEVTGTEKNKWKGMRMKKFPAFPIRFLQFSAPCFASRACIASSASSGMMLAMLGVLSSTKHPQKNTCFWTRFWTPHGDATKVLKNRLNQSTNPSPLLRAGPAQKRMLTEGKPSGLGLRPITSGGRIYRCWRTRPVASRGSTSQLLQGRLSRKHNNIK